MRIYLWTAGIFCIVYYLILCLYSKKYNSTFTLFWPAAAAAHLFMGMLPPQGAAIKCLTVVYLVFLAVFVAVEFQIFKAMTKKAGDHIPCLIILGAQVRGTKITNSLMRRLDAALTYLNENPETRAIVSGGQGKGEEISEARAMADYLIAEGIEKNRILLEEASTSTIENLWFSSGLLDDMDTSVAVVTNNFHLYRALEIGKKVGYKSLQGIAASSAPVFQLNYLVREFFAIIRMRLHRKISQ